MASNNSITDEMKARVEQWYDFVSNTDTENCNIAYLRSRHKQLVESSTKLANLLNLFRLGQLNLFDTCRKQLGEINVKFNRELVPPMRSKLLGMRRAYELWRSGRSTEEQLADSVLKNIDAELIANKSEIMNYWRRGPCIKVANVAAGFDMNKFQALVEIADFNGLSFKKTPDKERLPGVETETPNELSNWAETIEICDRLSEMVPKLVKYNTLKKVVMRKLEDFFNSPTAT